VLWTRGIRLVSSCALVLTLMACGGGGDDDGGSPPPPAPTTYSITATITGLTASGLVLQNNGAGNVTVTSGATSATIASGVSSGASYAVTVQTQPTGQTCTVASGTGTVTANVSNVAVTCTTPPAPTITVGGTITGLTGSGLALRLNGQTGASFNATPAAGAVSFGFTQLLANGATYTVSVAAHPSNPAQICALAAATGTINASNVSNVAVTCTDSTPFSVGGTVTGLTGTGLTLRMGYRDAPAPAVLNIAANGAFTFTETVTAPGGFGVGILTQPTGQTCTIVRGKGISITNITDIGVACINNPASALTGTYSFLPDAQEERVYANFNSNGTFTTALIQNDADCGGTRNGNGVEYGVFTWNQATGAFHPVIAAAVDTNGGCGLVDDGNFADSFNGTLTRVGNTLVGTDGGQTVFTATAVESNPASLVGGFINEADNGILLVLHSDGTFLFAETQSRIVGPTNGQERGCYTISGANITFSIASTCTPDGFPARDLNGPYGIFGTGVTSVGPMPFTIDNATTVTIGGAVYKRTQPN
jgi:hypothetical protein